MLLTISGISARKVSLLDYPFEKISQRASTKAWTIRLTFVRENELQIIEYDSYGGAMKELSEFLATITHLGCIQRLVI